MQVDEFTKSVQLGNPVKDKDLLILSELLMRELLKLDAIQGEGEVKQDRRAAVRFSQRLLSFSPLIFTLLLVIAPFKTRFPFP